MFYVKLALSAAAVAVEDGVELTVTAKSYVRDLFCMADKVDAKASVAEGMVSLLPGEKASCCISPLPMPQRLPQRLPLRVRSQPPTCRVPPTIRSANGELPRVRRLLKR